MDWIDRLGERRLQEAMDAGEFDNLPLAGKPLDLGNLDDPDWWVKRHLAQHGVDGSDLLPTPLLLRREARSYPHSLTDIPSEDAVREILDDFNRRVRRDWLTPTPTPMPHARLVDIEGTVAQWRTLREQQRGQQRPATPSPEPRRRRWWRRQS